ncbi:MAG: SDR family NAD(P)-dependent oxidoreductase, partial [Micromonosporaceae bacterium]
MTRLAGRSVIVTGGGHGIGKACCKRLADEGATVVIAELDGAAAEELERAIRDAGGKAVAIQTDVAD